MQRFIGNTDFRAHREPLDATHVGSLLVTGGTGFIGGAVLAELLECDLWNRSLFLVRARTLAEGRQRLIASLERFQPDVEVSRVLRDEQIVLGCLEQVDLLLTDARLRDVTHVIHSAAVTSFSRSPRINKVNVDGSLALVNGLASMGKVERFLNVGTAWCVGLGADKDVREGVFEDSGEHSVPYTASKITFERRVRAELPDFPFVSARPSIVVGHTRLGTAPSGSIYWVFRSAVLIRSFTCRLSDRIDVVPVDWVARSLLELVAKPKLAHDAYQLSSGARYASTIAQVEEAIARGRGVAPLGSGGYECIEEAQVASRVQAARTRIGDASPGLLAKALTIYGRFAKAGVTFDNTRTLAEGLPPPPPFWTYADRCAATAEGSSIASQMEDDFK